VLHCIVRSEILAHKKLGLDDFITHKDAMISADELIEVNRRCFEEKFGKRIDEEFPDQIYSNMLLNQYYYVESLGTPNWCIVPATGPVLAALPRTHGP